MSFIARSSRSTHRSCEDRSRLTALHRGVLADGGTLCTAGCARLITPGIFSGGGICDECVAVCVAYIPLRSKLAVFSAIVAPWAWLAAIKSV